MENKYREEFAEELKRQIVHLGIKRDYLQHMMDSDTLVDNTEENVAKVKLDIQILHKKVEELQAMLDWMHA